MREHSHNRDSLVDGEFSKTICQSCNAKDMQTFNLFPSGFRNRSLKDVPSQTPTALSKGTTIRYITFNVPARTIAANHMLWTRLCRTFLSDATLPKLWETGVKSVDVYLFTDSTVATCNIKYTICQSGLVKKHSKTNQDF